MYIPKYSSAVGPQIIFHVVCWGFPVIIIIIIIIIIFFLIFFFCRMLAVHCCAGECYLLLTALLKHRLVEPRLPGPWQLMHSSLQQPTK